MPYIVDYPGISVVGVASLSGLLAGEDQFRLLPFAQTVLFWSAIVLLSLFAWRRIRPSQTGR
jgi:hypothetical protein